MSSENENTAQLLSKNLRPIAIIGSLILLIMIGMIGIPFFATKTVDGQRIVYGIEQTELSDDQLIDTVERRAYAFSGLNCKVAILDGGKQLQIDLPTEDLGLASYLGSLLRAKGELRFLPLADPANHALVIQAAKESAAAGNLSRDVKDQSGEKIGRWVSIDQTKNSSATGWPTLRCSVDGVTMRNSETGEILDLNSVLANPADENEVGKWMVDNGVSGMDALAVIEPNIELGSYQLSFVSLTYDENAKPAIALKFTNAGGGAMFALTSLYAPVGTRQHCLGVVVDDRLLSAPRILQPIRNDARITGDFTVREISGLIQLLKLGHLPVELSESPVSEQLIKMTQPLVDSR